MKDLGAKYFSRRERTAIESAQLVTKLDASEIPRIKKSVFGTGAGARDLV